MIKRISLIGLILLAGSLIAFAQQGVNVHTEKSHSATTIQAEKRVWNPEQYASTQGQGARSTKERLAKADTPKNKVVDLAENGSTQGTK